MRKIVFAGPKQITIVEEEDQPLNPKDIRIRSICNGISHGTEMNFYRGTAPHINNDIVGGLFLPKTSQSPYPIWHGYETVGEVIEVGKEVSEFKVGDIAWTGNSHMDVGVCDTTIQGRPFFCEKAPENADPEAGIFLALAGVAYDGYLTSKLQLGTSCVVSGLGCIGLLTIQLLKLAGVGPIYAVDPIKFRRDLALEFGANIVIDPLKENVAEAVMKSNCNKGVDAAIETSGNWKALHESIRCCASGYGRVVALGFYQGPGNDLRLGNEFHHSSFYDLGASTILAINNRREPTQGRAWDRIRVYHTLAKMLGDGRLKTQKLLTHKYPFEKAKDAFELIDNHPEEVVKVALTFN